MTFFCRKGEFRGPTGPSTFETLTGEQVAARLVSVMRSRAHRGKTMDEWRKEQLAWLLDPVRPAKKG